jgi:hypothetical protein
MGSADGGGRLVQKGIGQKQRDEWRSMAGFNDPGISKVKLFQAMAYRCCCRGQIRLDLAEVSRKSGLRFADGAALELKGDVMVVHGEGNHAQEEAGRQEQTDTSPGRPADAIIECLDHFHKHAVSYGIYAAKSRIMKGAQKSAPITMPSAFPGRWKRA